jgi:hypothetical protein
MQNIDLKMLALQKHFVMADSVHLHTRRSVGDFYERTNEGPFNWQDYGFDASIFNMLSVFYALLYVVVEGYKELDCKCEEIDKLLEQEDLVSALRRFRNSIFHYQQDPISEKHTNFIFHPEAEHWPIKLHRAFRDFIVGEIGLEFAEESRKRYEATLIKASDLPHGSHPE